MKRSHSKTKTACVLMTGGFEMDQRPGNPINTLPIVCKRCGLADVDFVPQPYLLGHAAAAPTEMARAQRGNFLVRERVRGILELTVPGACSFYQTADVKSKRPLPWWLAVPNKKLKADYPSPRGPYCPVCREASSGIEGINRLPVFKRMKKFDSKGVDVFKTLPWVSDWRYLRACLKTLRVWPSAPT